MNPSDKNNKKINLLIAVAGLNIGGAEVVINHLVQTISKDRFNITVCCIKVSGVIGDELASQGIDVVILSEDGENKVEYFTFTKLLKVIRSRKIDIIHTHTTDALADAAVCKLLKPGLKLIHTFHFGNYPHLSNRLMWMERIFSRVASKLYAVGDIQREQLKSVYHFRDKRIGRVWNGIPMRQNKTNGKFRVQIGAGEKVLIGTIATLIQQKGLQDLLKVAREFRNYKDRVHFVIIGDGPLRPELEKTCKEYRIEDLVTLTGWVRDAAKVALPSFDIFFQPSLWEAMSIVILEAMAAAKPIVATRVGENVKIIENNVDGLLVDVKDTIEMAKALRRLVGDPELRDRFGNEASNKVLQRFTADHMTRNYEKIYWDIV